MQNILLRYCREANGYSIRTVAARLGITPTRYKELENGRACVSLKQAGKLEKLYQVKSQYFYLAALQLELLHNCQEVVIMQKQTIARLNVALNSLKNSSEGIKCY